MPRRDFDHELIRRLLQAAGWTITHDPILLWFARTPLYVDLGAEKEGRQIAVEIKGNSIAEMPEFERALGQVVLYNQSLPTSFDLFLAVPQTVFAKLFEHAAAQEIGRRLNLKLLVFDAQQGVLNQWIEQW